MDNISNEDSLKKRYLIKLLASSIGGAIGILMISIVPKLLGPSSYGSFVYLQDIFVKTISFLEIGSSTAFFTKLSANDHRKELIFFYAIVLIFILFSLLFLVMLSTFTGIGGLVFPDIKGEYIYLGAIFVFLTWVSQVLIKTSDAYVLTVSTEVLKICYKLLVLALLLIVPLILDFNLYIFYLTNYVAIILYIVSICIIFNRKNLFDNFPKFDDINFKLLSQEFLTYCKPLFVNNLVVISTGAFSLWLLQYTSGNSETGFYGLAYSIAAICILFTSSLAPLAIREFSKLYALDDIYEIKRIFTKYLRMMYGVSAYFSAFIFFNGELIVNLFADERFFGVSTVLLVMALYPMHQVYGQLSGGVFYATERVYLMRNITLIMCPLSLLFSIYFIYIMELGAVGLALSMVLTQVVDVNVQLIYNCRFLKVSLAKFIWHQVYSPFCFFILAFVSSRILEDFSVFLSLLASGAIYTLLSVIMILCLPEILSINKKQIKNLFGQLLLNR